MHPHVEIIRANIQFEIFVLSLKYSAFMWVHSICGNVNCEGIINRFNIIYIGECKIFLRQGKF